MCQICNDLESLTAVGSLLVYGLEGLPFGYEGVSVGRLRWKWLDPWLLDNCIGDSSSTHIRALATLLRHRFLVATYKKVSIDPLRKLLLAVGPINLPVYKVRLYCVSNDINGARFIKQWRNKYALDAYLRNAYRSSWLILREVTDFSLESWNGLTLPDLIVMVPLASESKSPRAKQEATHESFHLKRWFMSLPNQKPVLTPDPSLESVVKRIYDNISPPDLSRYEDNGYTAPNGILSFEETIKGLINGYYHDRFPLQGISSTLYPFQLKSVCAMYEKELLKKREVVPNFTSVSSPTGLTYYVNIFNFEIYRLPELFLLPRGGILAENMGLGKTLMCLSLICLTKHQISMIPDDAILHDDQSLDGTDNQASIELPQTLKPLWIICRDLISQMSLPWKYYKDDLPSSVIEKLSTRPGYFKLSLDTTNNQLGLRARQKAVTHDRSRMLYLCNTSLVVVPENLLHQWHSEMTKHVTTNYLRSLFVSDRFRESMLTESAAYMSRLPHSARELIQQDLIVMTIPLFLKQSRSDDTILKSIYWKRLIIDEGHSMSSKSTTLSSECKALFCESMWAVTGTPTSGLTNLHMNEEEAIQSSPTSKKRKYTVKSSFSVRDDLARLGNLVSNFFKIEPYHSQPRLWGTTIVQRLTSGDFSTEPNLKQLLNYLLVRHDLSDIERDLKLPKLHHEAVYITPSYHNRLAINLFTAVLAVNAVSSEREGSDYMFDSKNYQQLRRLVNNLQLATFYWTGFKRHDIETLLKIAQNCLKKESAQRQPYYSTSDRELLKKSIQASMEALKDPGWNISASFHEMLYDIEGIPNQIAEGFRLGSGKIGPLLGAPQKSALQNFYYKNRFLDMSDHIKLDSKLRDFTTRFWGLYWNDIKRRNGKENARHPGEHDMLSGSKNSLVDSNADSDIEILQKKHIIRNLSVQENRKMPRVDRVVNLRDASIKGTASSKLSYLTSKLVENQRLGLKSIVFFEFEDSAYYLSEFLDIVGVNYILYATFIDASQRANNLIDFDNHDVKIHGGITLIMDLRLASHGLTVISATRVYFMSPVWHTTREAQAIKRAHRIGQTQEVYVETLVMKGTLEEEIYRRRAQRNESSLEDMDTKHEMIDDAGMQQFLLRHEFLPQMEHLEQFSSFIIPSHGSLNEEDVIKAEFDTDSLQSHTMTKKIDHGKLYHHWDIKLFTQDNLNKLNKAKQQKPSRAQANKELLHINNAPENISPERRERVGKKRRVQFR